MAMESPWKVLGWGPGVQDRFFIDFGGQLGANLGPSWGHIVTDLSGAQVPFLLDWILMPLGSNFGYFFISKNEEKSELKINI